MYLSGEPYLFRRRLGDPRFHCVFCKHQSDIGTCRSCGGAAHDGARVVQHDGVTPHQYKTRVKLAEFRVGVFEPAVCAHEAGADERIGTVRESGEALVAAGEARTRIEVAQAVFELTALSFAGGKVAAQGSVESRGRVIDALHAAGERAMEHDGGSSRGLFVEAAREHGEAVAHEFGEAGFAAAQAVEHFLALADDHSRGGRGSGGAEVGYEIGNGDVGFVADGGDDRDGRGGDGAGDGFFVEGPKIFERAAAAGDGYELRPVGCAEVFDAAANFVDGACALHLRGEEANVEAGEAARQDFDEILNDRAFGRGDDADAQRIAGERAFARDVEKAFFAEAGAELLEGELQGAVALGFDAFDDELVFAALLVDIDTAADENLNAIFRLELQAHVRELPADAFDLGVGVLEDEVAVAAGRGFGAGDFAGNPDVGEVGFERGANAVAQFAQGEDAAFGEETQGILFHLPAGRAVNSVYEIR